MNIILIVSDTFRYDNLFDRAAMPVRTPCLDAFSQRAVSASRMWNSSFPTIPHRTDLTTGRYGWPWYGWQSRLASSPNHLPEILGRAGYVSQLLCDCPHLLRADFDKGFHAAQCLRGQEADLPMLRMNHPIRSVMPPEKTRTGHHFQGHNLPDLARWTNRYWRGEEDRFPPRTARLVVEWLEENYRYDPFFLWVDFFDPHEPWDPPEYMVRRYDPDYTGAPMIHPNYGRADDLEPAELQNLRAHYAAEAELVDRWVGRILQKIDDLGLWQNSIVVFTTDHGISLGEHNRTGKANINDRDDRAWPVYPEIAHLPFLIAAPGLAGGRQVDALLQPPDILPTVADLAGLHPETPEPLHGRSFAPLLRGQAQAPLRDVAISASFLRRRPDEPVGTVVTPALYTQEWCYVPLGPRGRRELYRLADDPLGETNVVADHGRVADDLHARLIGWLRQMDAPAEAVAALDVT
ncbi:MAG TPA: sulfatase [Phycisphaerae bacterium]|nr:sulfatase [Phycisphaerae bacterium]